MPLLHNLSVIWHMEIPLIGVQRLIEWLQGYQLVYQVSRAICSASALSIHVPCMRLHSETLILMGLSASKDCLLVSRLNALYTPLAWIPRELGFSHICCFQLITV